MPELSKKDEKLIQLAERGGKDAELFLLDLIHELQEKMEKIEKEHEEFEEYHEKSLLEVKTGIPKFQELIESIQKLAEKEIPAPVINIPKSETKIEVKAPIVNVQPSKVEVSAPNVTIPPPVVNVSQEGKVEIDETTKKAVEELRERLEIHIQEMNKRLEEVRPRFAYGKTWRIFTADLSSSLNGSTKSFFVGTHFGIIGVWGSSTPFAFRPTTDYTESGKNILFTDAVDAPSMLAAGQSLIVLYLK